MYRVLSILILCSVTAAQAWAGRWVDSLGRTLQVPDAPQRIVSVVPSVTETLFAVGLGDRVVGVTRFCNYPVEVSSKPKVGGYADPSLEVVVAMAPDLVFASADSTKATFVSRLEALGIPAFVVYPRNVAETVETIRTVGRVAGAPGQGERAAEDLARAVREVRAATAGRPRTRVLLCVMLHPLVVAGPGTLGDDLIRLAGGENVVSSGPARYPTWGPEALLAADPEVIIVSGHPGEDDPLETFKPWPELRAVARGRVVTVEPDWVHRAGPRLSLGLKALAEAIHPGVLSGIRP